MAVVAVERAIAILSAMVLAVGSSPSRPLVGASRSIFATAKKLSRFSVREKMANSGDYCARFIEKNKEHVVAVIYVVR